MELGEAASLCICPECPTYSDCGEPVAFCMHAEGKSRCIEVERGCICPSCPVFAVDDLKHDFYCTRGPEKVQSAS